MMLIDTSAPTFDQVGPDRLGTRRGPGAARRACAVQTRPPRLARTRPGGAPLEHRGSGVLMSRTAHRPQPVKPITPATTVVLALIAAGITVWLGLVAQFGASMAGGGSPALPEQLGVVRVQSGESLQRLAARVAPDAPTAQVVDRIRELNNLESAALDAGQPLIAPIG